MNLSDSQRKIASNVIWSLGGKTVNMASALFVGILVARYLGPENYGIMNYVISYVAIFTVFATFGLDNIEIRELTRQNRLHSSGLSGIRNPQHTGRHLQMSMRQHIRMSQSTW